MFCYCNCKAISLKVFINDSFYNVEKHTLYKIITTADLLFKLSFLHL